MIIGVDLNYAIDKSIDIKRPYKIRACRKHISSGPSVFSQLLSSYNLTDIWRFFNPSDRSYTYFSPRFQTYTRIDYLFVSTSLLFCISTSEIGSVTWSDHAPVTAEFFIQEHKNEYKNWSLNSNILEDPLLFNYIKKHLEEYFSLNKTDDVSIQTTWEASKAVIRGHFISLAASKKKI